MEQNGIEILKQIVDNNMHFEIEEEPLLRASNIILEYFDQNA